MRAWGAPGRARPGPARGEELNVRPISGASVDARGRGRKKLWAPVVGVLLLAVTACGGGGGTESGAGGAKEQDSSATQSKQSEAVVSIAPKDGAKSVDTSGALKVGAAKGKLAQVEVKNAKGTAIPGKITPDGASWTPATHLAASTTYTVHAVAKDSAGRTAAEDSRFTTLTPQNTFVGNFTPE